MKTLTQLQKGKAMAGKKVEYLWFVEPLDSETNNVFAETIGDDSDYSVGVICNDGSRHNLWRCPWKLVYAFQRARRQKGLHFRIFNSTNGGKIRECTFLYRKVEKVA